MEFDIKMPPYHFQGTAEAMRMYGMPAKLPEPQRRLASELKLLVELQPHKMALLWPNGQHEIVSVKADLAHKCWDYVNFKRGGAPRVIRAGDEAA